MSVVKIRVDGIAEMRSALVSVGKRLVDKGAVALKEEAGAVLKEAQDNHVPIKHGILRDSGKVEILRRGFWTTATISFGGSGIDYAIAVHEHPSEFSPPSWSGNVTFNPPGRGPKYLERPLRAAMPGMAARIGRLMR